MILDSFTDVQAAWQCVPVRPQSEVLARKSSVVKSQKTLVITATYNEIENLPHLVDAVFEYAPDVDLLVIDDNSPDGTGTWCADRAAKDERVHCLHRAGKQGLGTAILEGMTYAIQHRYKYVLNMDADFSHHPKYLRDLIDAMDLPSEEPADVVIGSRYVSGGGVAGWPLKRHVMSRSVNLYARWLLWLTPRDCSGGYRCYRTSSLSKVDFASFRSRGYSFQEEILWLLRRERAVFRETPIVFADRERGRSKINSKEAWSALRIIASLGAKSLFSRS